MFHWRRVVFVTIVTLTTVLYYVKLNEKVEVKQQKRIPLPQHREKYNRTLTWAVHIKSSNYTHIDNIAHELQMLHKGPVGHLEGIYLFVLKNLTSDSRKQYLLNNGSEPEFETRVSEVEEKLGNHGDVVWFSQEVVVSRQKRSVQPQFVDPFYKKQWHLHNAIHYKMDVNVTDVWGHGVTGRGVTVAVVDDGLEWNNPDLVDNYNKAGSWDLNDNDEDPMPDGSKSSNHHGTRCAGEISAVPNKVCGVGVAYGAKISGLRILDGPMTDSLEASAFTKNFQVNDIYSCSWGPDDDGKTVDGPHTLASASLKHGIDFGRRGYGSIYVMASGNGGPQGDNCNFDGYANSIYTLTIGAVDETGSTPYYAEECSSMLATTFSSGSRFSRDIVTTDWTAGLGVGRSGCTEHHTGTSASAPIAAGLIALMLEAQPCLTWRDVQYIIILTAVMVDTKQAHYTRNGAGLWHSHKHGFGLMDAWRLVNAAKVWSQVPWLTSLSHSENVVALQIPKGARNPLNVSHTVSEGDTQKFDLYILETVQVTLTLSHPCRGQLEMQLISPNGTKSVMGAPRPQDKSSTGLDHWTFSTVRCWGETAQGKWQLLIIDHDRGQYETGTLQSWTLKLYGTSMSSDQLTSRRRVIEKAMHGHLINSTSFCAPPPVTSKPDVKLSVKTLKVLSLVGFFCFVLAVYESLEYLFCYNEEKTEQSKVRRLVTRAHELAYRALRSDSGNQPHDPTERTGLLDEEVAMTTLPNDLDFQSGFVNCEAENVVADGYEDETSFIVERSDVQTDDMLESVSRQDVSEVVDDVLSDINTKCSHQDHPDEPSTLVNSTGAHMSMQLGQTREINHNALSNPLTLAKEILKQKTSLRLPGDPRYALLQQCSSDSNED